MNPDNPDRHYYPALDGLRGLAILLVVVFHNFGFINYFFFGWMGVDLFFVLSGFLITDILLRTLSSKNYLTNFYVRRILRIFPLYYLCLFLFLIILPRLDISFDVKYYSEHQVWLWAYLQNWLYVFKNPDPATTLNHLWSLAVEEQFYLVWPLVILLIRKPKYLLVFILLLLVTVLGLRIWIWTRHIPGLAYSNLYAFSRIDGLCVGCLMALLQRINIHFLKKYMAVIVLSFAGLNFIFYFINRRSHFSYPYLASIGYPTIAMLFGLLVNEAVTRGKLVSFIFNIPALKFFGRISYGLYIFHWPVYVILTPYLFTLISKYITGIWSQVAVSIFATGAAIIVSWISYRYYERYFLNLKDRFA